MLEDTPYLKEVLRFEATAESRTKKEETMSYEIIRGILLQLSLSKYILYQILISYIFITKIYMVLVTK